MKNLKGFVDYDIDAVVKFGGSLLGVSADAMTVADGLRRAAAGGRRVLVVPGGGPTDKAIEALDKRHPFGPDTHHRACARAQDQTGLMFCDPAFGPGREPCETLEQVRAATRAGLVPVLLPSRLIFDLDPFERAWEITSDAMAVWFAWLVGAKTAVILTNVDGVYPPGSTSFAGAPVAEVTASELTEWGHTSVDRCTAPFSRRHGIDVFVAHGGKPGRLEAILAGQPAVCTHIRPV